MNHNIHYMPNMDKKPQDRKIVLISAYSSKTPRLSFIDTLCIKFKVFINIK